MAGVFVVRALTWGFGVVAEGVLLVFGVASDDTPIVSCLSGRGMTSVLSGIEVVEVGRGVRMAGSSIGPACVAGGSGFGGDDDCASA